MADQAAMLLNYTEKCMLFRIGSKRPIAGIESGPSI
jgi:hypothetical protein